MTDELKAIEQRAAERRARYRANANPALPNDDGLRFGHKEAEADLDRAIKVAKNAELEVVKARSNAASAWKEARDRAEERDQARADVLEGRKFLDLTKFTRSMPWPERDKYLADTEHYEQYR